MNVSLSIVCISLTMSSHLSLFGGSYLYQKQVIAFLLPALSLLDIYPSPEALEASCLGIELTRFGVHQNKVFLS